jgi:hypothetical protein
MKQFLKVNLSAFSVFRYCYLSYFLGAILVIQSSYIFPVFENFFIDKYNEDMNEAAKRILNLLILIASCNA